VSALTSVSRPISTSMLIFASILVHPTYPKSQLTTKLLLRELGAHATTCILAPMFLCPHPFLSHAFFCICTYYSIFHPPKIPTYCITTSKRTLAPLCLELVFLTTLILERQGNHYGSHPLGYNENYKIQQYSLEVKLLCKTFPFHTKFQG